MQPQSTHQVIEQSIIRNGLNLPKDTLPGFFGFSSGQVDAGNLREGLDKLGIACQSFFEMGEGAVHTLVLSSNQSKTVMAGGILGDSRNNRLKNPFGFCNFSLSEEDLSQNSYGTKISRIEPESRLSLFKGEIKRTFSEPGSSQGGPRVSKVWCKVHGLRQLMDRLGQIIFCSKCHPKVMMGYRQLGLFLENPLKLRNRFVGLSFHHSNSCLKDPPQ